MKAERSRGWTMWRLRRRNGRSEGGPGDEEGGRFRKKDMFRVMRRLAERTRKWWRGAGGEDEEKRNTRNEAEHARQSATESRSD